MAQSEKRENSVLFSLRELRQIEENRVQEEEHAVRSAEEERRMAKEAQEKASRDAEDARIRSERDAQLQIETARETAERQRQQAALEQQRLQQEMELRRAEVAKKRPTWMLVVTGIALVAAVGLVFFAIQRMKESDASKEAEKAAQVERDVAVKAAAEAQDKVERLARDLEDLDKKLGSAVDGVVAAQTDADRSAAKGKLEALRKEKYEMEQRIAEAKAAAARAERKKGFKVSKECEANPLAKGCT